MAHRSLPLKPIKFAKHQRGIASLLITSLTGLALGAVTMGAMSQINGTQKSQETMHAATQAQIKAWQGAAALGNYLQTTAATTTLTTCLAATNCDSLALASSDFPASVSATATAPSAFNYATGQITVSSTGVSGGATATVNAVYRLQNAVQQTANTSPDWQFGALAKLNGNVTFANISSIGYVSGATITLSGGSAPPLLQISAVPTADFNSLMSLANFAFYIDKNVNCTGGEDTSGTANTSGFTCLVVKNVDYYNGGINTALDGRYALTCTAAGCAPTASITTLSAEWSLICGALGSCLTYSTPAGASTGGAWTLQSFNSPGVLWFEGDFKTAGTINDALIVTGNATVAGATITAPTTGGAGSTCKVTFWPTNLCTAHNGTLTGSAIGNSALLQGGSAATDLKGSTINGNIFTNGSLQSQGSTYINGSAVVASVNGYASTLNGTKVTGATGNAAAIVFADSQALAFQWARYR